ncbi:MAG: hypothetical protein II336_15240 [Loktanella sp.]|nr:hypothetical protein [Loktanella sp.]
MQKKIDADAETRKGFTVTSEGEPIHLPLVYGYQKLGGVRSFHNTTSSYTLGAIQNDFQRFRIAIPTDSASAQTKQFLWTQQAFCFGGIDSVIDVEVNGLSWNDETFSHVIDISRNGGVANASASASGVPAANKFTSICYATSMFKLNREDPNYNGVPDVAIYVRGNRIHTIVESSGNYALSQAKVFSNNPAYVLLDYLIRPKQLGGCGYGMSDINLRSFFNAAQICNVKVAANVNVKGRINGIAPLPEGAVTGSSIRDIKLYECNITLDTNETRRDNIERLLETMSQSDLIWSEGQYKLVLDYPSSEAAQNSLVTATYTDDDIINSEITVAWAGVQDKFNRAVVKFLNEEQDFATDSVSFPAYASTQHQSYLSDDNGIENEIEYFIPGATHRRSALAKAEELVRNSRISKVIEFELDRQALVHDQGDLIKINSASAKIEDEIYRIEEMAITSTLSVKIKAVRFDYRTLAYNVSDSFVTNPKVTLPSGVPNVLNLAWNAGSRVGGLSNGWLSWTVPNDDTIRRYLVYYREVSGEYVSIGETRTNYFDIPSELNDGKNYFFLVRSEGASGRLSPGAIILLDQLPALVPLINFAVNTSVGINSVTFSWNYPNPEIVRRFDIYQATVDDRAMATRVASSTTNSVIVAPLPVASYYFWIDVVGDDGAVANMFGSLFVSALTLGVKTGDFPAFQAMQEYLTDSVFLQAKDDSTSSELELATYADGEINVSTARISADAILLDGSVTTETLRANAVTANKIAANAITADKIAANAITADKVAAGAINASKIVTDSLTLSLFSSGVLQVPLYPIGVDIIDSSRTFWPRFNGLAQVYVIGGGGGGGAACSPAQNNPRKVATGGGAGGMSTLFIPNLSIGNAYTAVVGGGGGGAYIAGGGIANGGWGGASHFYGHGIGPIAYGGVGGFAHGNTGDTLAGGTGGGAASGNHNYQGGNGGAARADSGGQMSMSSGGALNANINGWSPNADGIVDGAGGGQIDGASGHKPMLPGNLQNIEVSGFPLRGVANFDGGTGRSRRQNASMVTATGDSSSRGGGGGGAVASNGEESGGVWARGGNGGAGLIVVIYYGAGNLK